MKPCVGIIYTKESTVSREETQLAQYVALCIAFSGCCSKTFLVGIEANVKSLVKKCSNRTKSRAVARRCDGVLIDNYQLSSDTYEETDEWMRLETCDLWVLLLDTDATLSVVEFLYEKLDKQKKERPKRVVLSLQTTMRRLAQLNAVLPEAIVLHGGAAFQVIKDEKSILRPLSSGCFFVERLSKEKTSALYALDVLEATKIQVLSRCNIQAMKWGCTMLRSFYYINALTGRSTLDGLRDRKTRFLFLQALVEMDKLFREVLTNIAIAQPKSRHRRNESNPDTSAATLFPVQSLMVLLPLPDWIFNGFILRFFDLGLGDAVSVISSDLKARPFLETNFDTEFRDVFELATGRKIALPALKMVEKYLVIVKRRQKVKQLDGGSSEMPVGIDSAALLAEVKLDSHCTRASRTFFLKVLTTFVLTMLLAIYLFV
ncbi:hypothetical protein PsorP6_008831 [Peronosclerospora sorghi]|uniref:Uncharacterized protein n=1 Tax=Peronosclerospora sorghi TaxID=230839 RepID=A0ACC0VX29_9STRA|nr:hypothetical protein PsorP6_008831 [Peronosclerospora sorghi]